MAHSPHKLSSTDDTGMLYLSVFTGLCMALVEHAWPLLF